MSDAPSDIKCFQSLAEAVDFISDCTESDSAITLFNQTVEAERQTEKYIERPDHFAQWVFPQLRRQYQIMDFRDRYRGRSFPVNAQRLKLGGHDKELGHIHIDFIKRGEGWVIERICECR